jgi:hypothetical protein
MGIVASVDSKGFEEVEERRRAPEKRKAGASSHTPNVVLYKNSIPHR